MRPLSWRRTVSGSSAPTRTVRTSCSRSSASRPSASGWTSCWRKADAISRAETTYLRSRTATAFFRASFPFGARFFLRQGRPLFLPSVDWNPPPIYGIIMGILNNKEITMTNTADIAAQRRPGRPRRLSGRRAGDDPSLRGERATGRVRAAVREAEGGAAWA